jgi:Fe-S cluster assembly protein SufB
LGYLRIPEIDYREIIFYAAPKQRKALTASAMLTGTLKTFDKLGIPLEEQKHLAGVAVDPSWTPSR